MILVSFTGDIYIVYVLPLKTNNTRSMKLITIKSSHYPADLQVLKSRLASEGIESIIDGELNSQVLSHIPSMEAELKVYESDIERVKAILEEVGELGSNSKIVCPKCGSEKYRIKYSLRYKWRLFLSALLSAITFTPTGRNISPTKLICERCETEFMG